MFILYVLLTILFVWFTFMFVTSHIESFVEAWIGMWVILFMGMAWAAVKDHGHYKMLWSYIPLTTNEWFGTVLAVAAIFMMYEVATLD